MSERVNGPYRHRNKWRVHIIISNGGESKTEYQSFETEDEAKKFKRAVEREIFQNEDASALRDKAEDLRKLADHYAVEADRRDGRGLTVGIALQQYLDFMRDVKGNKPGSIDTTRYRIRGLLKDMDASITRLTERQASDLYRRRCTECKSDTHRNELGVTKTFMNWCVEQGWVRRNPFAKVKGIGKRSQGKEQLRIRETRTVSEIAFEQARKPAHGLSYRERQHKLSALGVLVALYLALRAKEIVSISKRDVDEFGHVLWIPDSKTKNGRRALEVAGALAPLLWKRAQACGNDPTARLFPRTRYWVRDNVMRLCREAGVPEVTAHGMRGIHATIAARMGATSQLVAQALGHDPGGVVTERHYIRSGALDAVSRDRFQQILAPKSEGKSVEGRAPGRVPDSFIDAENEPPKRETIVPETVSHAKEPPETCTLGRSKHLD